MKKYIFSFLLIILFSALSASENSNFIFVKKKNIGDEIEVYFRLTSKVNSEKIKTEFLKLEKVRKFGIVEESNNYYKLLLIDESENTIIRDIIMNNNSDIHKDYIAVSHKSFYLK